MIHGAIPFILFLADLSVRTVGEQQTPMHFAAKNNAAKSLKVMLSLGAHINERDYKRRTPLFVAAETGIFGFFSCIFIFASQYMSSRAIADKSRLTRLTVIYCRKGKLSSLSGG